MSQPNKVIIKALEQIRETIGGNVGHKEAGNFTFYTNLNNDYLVIKNNKTGQELVFNNSDKIKLEVKFDSIPRKEEVTKWVKRALVEAKKHLKRGDLRVLKERKAELLSEVKDIREKLKKHEPTK